MSWLGFLMREDIDIVQYKRLKNRDYSHGVPLWASKLYLFLVVRLWVRKWSGHLSLLKFADVKFRSIYEEVRKLLLR